MLEIVIATTNHHKAKELSELLRLRHVRWRTLDEFPGSLRIVEDGKTFEDNAAKKALAAARRTQCLALADDSGIEVDALGGGPGIYSARFSGKNATDRKNNEKLLRLLKDIPLRQRGAQYQCVLALSSPSKILALRRGRWRGRIANSPCGNNGFGYDPIFVVPHLRRTVGEMSPSVKKRLSHRAMAARRMRPVLARLIQKILNEHSRKAPPKNPLSRVQAV
ncbi:MAG: RdgB/HAM1 family non-canonical purine NTP pyrophosphatase [Candidatus Omnitrophica bacterium]|nr:RdgB/HAM1 family non-canonical purine NTP pyrophosphatase [Candidatus Omnitrophota bacterium]